MFVVEVYAAVRHFVFVGGNSRREAARIFGLSRETVLKICRFHCRRAIRARNITTFLLPSRSPEMNPVEQGSSFPEPSLVRPVAKPEMGALLPVIGAILEADGEAP